MARSPRNSPKLVSGHVVRAEVVDPQGRNRKTRPIVLLSGEDETPADQPLIAVAITATLPMPLPDSYVLLPWHRQRHPRTGLTKKCAAVCDWPVSIDRSESIEVMGRVPDRQFAQILSVVKAIREKEFDQQDPE